MTLGCGSWGGNVTSDNVSPLHLMDIKRVAFETRPVQSKRPALAAQPAAQSAAISQPRAAVQATPAVTASSGTEAPKVSRQEIAAIVDRFLANRPEAIPPPAVPRPDQSGSGNAGEARKPANAPSQPATNGRKAAEFVSEDDVKRAIEKGEKIFVGPRTIITPSARDIGDPAEVFAKI